MTNSLGSFSYVCVGLGNPFIHLPILLRLMQNSVYLSYTPIMGFGYDIFNSYDITMISAMASLAIACLLVSRSGKVRFTADWDHQ